MPPAPLLSPPARTEQYAAVCRFVGGLLGVVILVIGLGALANTPDSQVNAVGGDEFDWTSFTLYLSLAGTAAFIGYAAGKVLDGIAALHRDVSPRQRERPRSIDLGLRPWS